MTIISAQPRLRHWGSFTSANLPNVSGSANTSEDLQVGESAFDTTNNLLVMCTTATQGSAVWASFAQGSSGAGGTTQLHDTTHSPVSLWQLDDSYVDSGTAGETLSLVTGSDLGTEGAAPGFPSTKFDGATRLAGAGTAPASLRILGSMTIEALVRSGDDAGIGVIASVAGDYGSALEAQNILWDLRILDQAMGDLRFIWESGAGTVHSLTSTGYVLSRHSWAHIAAVRDATGGVGATIAKIYVNGEEVATISTLSPATGGTSAITRIGGSNLAGQFYGGNLASVKVVASALSLAQIQAEVRRTIPRQSWGF